jgi:hypothetical protein
MNLDGCCWAATTAGDDSRWSSPVEETACARHRIQDAISRIRREHPALALHFDNTIRTGTFCCYTPDRAMLWRL